MEWISVKNNLPEAGKIVQLFNRKWKLGKRVLVGDTTLWHYDGDTLYTYDAPSHWQPLPEPPKYDWKLCDQKVNGSCPHHNLHCGFPKCEQVPIDTSNQPQKAS